MLLTFFHFSPFWQVEWDESNLTNKKNYILVITGDNFALLPF